MGKLSPDAILKAIGKGKGGVAVAHNKLTAEKETVRIPIPETVTLPMLQHIGAPCTPTVKKGDYVGVGQIVGDSDKYVSAPIHASVSGKVIAVQDVKLANGKMAPAVTIESDGEMKLFEGIEAPRVTNKAELVKAIRESGLVGLGGAGFPTHVKLNTPEDKDIDTLIINAAECEPYITVDYRECLENSWNIMGGVYTLQEILGFKRVIIAVEDNKPQAIKILKDIADSDIDHGNIVRLMTLKSRYPQGAEKMMVLSATGRKVPAGGLPSDVGCVVMNVASTAFVSRYLKTGKPLTSRSVTVSGNCIKDPMNVRVPIGMEFQQIIDFCGGFTEEPYKILSGGPMMGTAVTGTDVPLLKSNNAILAFSKNAARIKPERECIRCGRCHAACPMSLIPTQIEKFAALKDAEMLSKLGTSVCMECGSCAYSCPAGKPLVQHMRLAKEVMRQAGVK
ncbi:MAG: electron transport complex subunit RsxC [Clostridia bacterium]|nr:electron transport complex subunit RsxC [Clostridia bacterium]